MGYELGFRVSHLILYTARCLYMISGLDDITMRNVLLMGQSEFAQGVDPDSSDKEWELSIKADFGERGAGMLREVATQIDVGLDTHGLVNHAFHQYDVMSEVAGSSHTSRPVGNVTPDAQEEATNKRFSTLTWSSMTSMTTTTPGRFHIHRGRRTEALTMPGRFWTKPLILYYMLEPDCHP